MSSPYLPVLWLLPLLLTSVQAGDSVSEVSCVFMESCVLPCRFQGGSDAVVHWYLLLAREIVVHSYYYNQDQLAHQDQRFSNRTSLFKNQVSRGNASLQLTGVKVQDQGRYKCYTSTIGGNKESFFNLKMNNPGKVNIQQVDNNITCSSERIYPEPQLTWSTSPPSNETFKNTTEVQMTEQLLYNISSSLMLTDPDLIYTCTVSTNTDSTNRRRATLFKPNSVSGSNSEATIPCTASHTAVTNFSLTWTFNRSQIILNQTRGVPFAVSERWRQQVKNVSESGGLMLQDLSSHHEGTYTCELSDAEETLVTNTLFSIQKGGWTFATVEAVITVVIILLLLGLIGLLVWRLYGNRGIAGYVLRRK